MNNIEIIKKEFYRIKSLGFVKSTRPNNTDGDIGNTFEDYLGVKENNHKKADFMGFEVKSRREFTSSYMSLFTKSPTSPKGANRFLKDTFGRGDSMFPELKSLHTSIFAHRWNSVYDMYKMKLHIDDVNDELVLQIADKNEKIISENVNWTYASLQKAMNKMKNLFVVSAQVKKQEGETYYFFDKATCYFGLNFERFISVLSNGNIMFDIRIGVYKSGKNIGKPHDHGSGFRIKPEKISEFYNNEIIL